MPLTLRRALLVVFALAGCGANQLPNHLDGAMGVKQVFLGGSTYGDMWFETLSNNNAPKALQHWNGSSLSSVTFPSELQSGANMRCGKGGCFFGGSAALSVFRLDASGTVTDLTSTIPSANASSRQVIASDDTTWLIQFEGASGSVYIWNGTAFAAAPAPPATANLGNIKPLTDTLAFIPERNGPGAYRFDGASWTPWATSAQGFGGGVNLDNAISLGSGGVWSVFSPGGAPAGTQKSAPPWQLDRWTGTDFERVEVPASDEWLKDTTGSYTGRSLAFIGGKFGAVSWRVEREVGSPTEHHSLMFNAINGTTMGPNVLLQTLPTCELGCTPTFVITLPDGTVVTDTGGSEASVAWGKPAL